MGDKYDKAVKTIGIVSAIIGLIQTLFGLKKNRPEKERQRKPNQKPDNTEE